MGVPEVSKTVQNHHNLGGRFEGGNYLVYGYLADRDWGLKRERGLI